MLELTLSQKQQTTYQILDDPSVVEVCFGGGAGGGKSWLVSTWSIIQCRKYPGIRIGLARKEITTLRKTTAQTYIGEVHPVLHIAEGRDFRYSSLVDPGIYYKNGSQVLFTDLAPAPSDPNFDRLGSLNLTHTVIEEAGEVVQKAAKVFSSRRNRYKNKQYKVTGKTIYTCNPTTNFLREEFYDPYLALGGGDHQVWEFENEQGEPVHVELPDGQLVRAKRAFIKSLPTDNPFLSENYLQTLKSLPDAERRRLLEGDWDFDDDDSKLFKLHLIKTSSDPPAPEMATWCGCDPSRGGDKTVFTAMQGDVVTDQLKVPIPATVEDKGSYVAERYIQFCQSHGADADHSAVDVVGIGASVQDSCSRLGFKVRAFNAGSTKGVRLLGRQGQIVEQRKVTDGVPLFDNIRSQGFYDLAQAFHTGALLLAADLPNASDLKRELGAHHYEVRERVTIVEKKDKIKAAIGHSPDFADSLLAAWWCKTYQPAVGFRVRTA